MEYVPGQLSELSREGHEVPKGVRHRLLRHVGYLFDAAIYIDPTGVSGNRSRRIQSTQGPWLPASEEEDPCSGVGGVDE